MSYENCPDLRNAHVEKELTFKQTAGQLFADAAREGAAVLQLDANKLSPEQSHNAQVHEMLSHFGITENKDKNDLSLAEKFDKAKPPTEKDELHEKSEAREKHFSAAPEKHDGGVDKSDKNDKPALKHLPSMGIPGWELNFMN